MVIHLEFANLKMVIEIVDLCGFMWIYVDLPMKIGDFPFRDVNVSQRVIGIAI